MWTRSGAGLVDSTSAGGRVLEVLGAEQRLVALRVLLLARGREHERRSRARAARRSARRRAPAPPRRARAPGSAASRTRAPRRRARARRPGPRPTSRAGRRPSRCGGAARPGGGCARACAARGTTRARAGSWSRSASRPRRAGRRGHRASWAWALPRRACPGTNTGTLRRGHGQVRGQRQGGRVAPGSSSTRASTCSTATGATSSRAPRTRTPTSRTHSWDEYARGTSGSPTARTDETKARYAFVYGDFRRIHRMGLIACVYRAAEWRHKEIELAAHDLLQ